MRKNDWILTIIWCLVIIAGLCFLVFMARERIISDLPWWVKWCR